MSEPLVFELTFGAESDHVTVTGSGTLDAQGLRRIGRALLEDPRLRPGMTVLVDLAEVDASPLDNEDELFLAVGPIQERDALAPPRAVAIVAADPATFERAVRYRAHLGGSTSRRRVFASTAEALAWLSEQRQ